MIKFALASLYFLTFYPYNSPSSEPCAVAGCLTLITNHTALERQKKQKNYTPKEALIKAAAYCAYQDRTQQEVREKLYSYGLEPDDVEELIIRLSQEKMIDEERYAQSYVRGKYGLKKWGRRKILQGLKSKGISDYCIKQGMKEIDPEVYEQNLLYLLEKKNATEKEQNPFQRRQKLTYFLVSKGYENDLVQDAIKGLED